MRKEFELAGPEEGKFITLNQLIIFSLLFTIAFVAIIVFVHKKNEVNIREKQKIHEKILNK